jgi:hypothetical protein
LTPAIGRAHKGERSAHFTPLSLAVVSTIALAMPISVGATRTVAHGQGETGACSAVQYNTDAQSPWYKQTQCGADLSGPESLTASTTAGPHQTSRALNDFQKKAKQLADAIPGREALAVFGPNGSVTAGFYNAALTTFNNATKTGRIFFEGGYNSTFYSWVAQIKANLGLLG